MINLLAHTCRRCMLGWVSTIRGHICPFCGSTDILVGGRVR